MRVLRALARVPRRQRLRRFLGVAATGLAATLSGIAGAPASLAAQQGTILRGSVVDSASGRPIVGAVVEALDASGASRGRVLTDASGSFTLRAAGEAQQLRVVRIGFRPFTLDLAPPAAVTATTQLAPIAMRRISAFLDPVRVVAAQCNERRNRGQSPIGLIEQARAGLLASVVTRDQNPAAMTRLTYERSFEDGPRVPTRQSVLVDSATQQTQSFRAARGAASYVAAGFYVEVDGDGYFDAPDAEVLLDDAFAVGYCFSVLPRDRSRPREVGLGFEPASRRAGRVDVDGALWIDTVSRELRSMEFSYIGLDRRIQARRPGGHIVFRTLPNGLVIVERWQLRLIGARVDTLASGRGGRTQTVPRYFDVHSGGELASADWRDGTTWRATLGTATGQARWRDAQPAAATTLVLSGTPFRATTDSAGRVVFRGVLPGTYALEVLDEPLRSVGLGIPTKYRIASNRDSVALSLTLPTRSDIVVDQCIAQGRVEVRSPPTYLLGRALRADGTPIEGAVWTLRAESGGEWSDIAVNGRTGSDGLMPYCRGLQRGSTIELVVRAPEGLVDKRRVRLDDAATVVPVVFPIP
jgi:hypothetical protein